MQMRARVLKTKVKGLKPPTCHLQDADAVGDEITIFFVNSRKIERWGGGF